ncbi:unnamed protein product, partial [Mesorhabditis belari]|uniref:Uncharacterized protein n=1 Tax=Mesorhabditis belari TaxID=2138241 RepID=A0AAF3EEQ3_9BILA
MLEGGFLFGPQLYASDEVSSEGENEMMTKSDEASTGIEEALIKNVLKGSTVAPHEAYQQEMARREWNVREALLGKAQLDAAEEKMAAALQELEEITHQAHKMTRCLQISRRRAVDQLHHLDAVYVAAEKGLLSEKDELMEQFKDTNLECARSLDEINSTINRVNERIATGNSLFETMESVRTALFELNFRADKLHASARLTKENDTLKQMLDNDVEKLLEAQAQLSATLQVPFKTQFNPTIWNRDIVKKNLQKLAILGGWVKMVGRLTETFPEGALFEEFLNDLHGLRRSIHKHEFVPMMLVRKEEMSDLESIDVDPSFNKKRNENSFTLFYDLDLPTHLSYSADSFVSAPEPLLNETGVSVQAVSSSARVEITESETRSMFANTTVTDDKSFVNPVTQSPLCPTAQEIASVMTAKTADSRHGLPTNEIVTADCTTAAEIVTPKLACPKQQKKVAQDVDERLVEPDEDLLTAVKQLSAGACSYDNLVICGRQWERNLSWTWIGLKWKRPKLGVIE